MYIRTGVKIRSFIHGGAQERKRRAGTENVPGIVGIGTAAKRAAANMEERTAKEREVRDYLIDRVLNEIPYCRLNGHRTDRLPNNANFSFQFVEGESLLIRLDMKESVHPADLHVHPDHWIRPMYCLRLVCHMKLRTDLCV